MARPSRFSKFPNLIKSAILHDLVKSVDGTLKHKGGRPTKRTPDRETLILAAIAKGIPYKVACKLGGVGFTTFNDWRHSNPLFDEKVEMAEGVAIARNVALIQEAASKDWKAAAWLLERRHPDMFSRPEVQLGHQVSVKTQENNLLIWTQPAAALPAPKGKSSFSSIGDIDFFCEAESML